MPSIKVNALVVKLIPYRESDRIAWLVTREAGLLSVIVPGARKSRKRFSNLLDIGNRIEICVARRRRGMGRVESGSLVNGYWALSGTPTGLAAASHVIELLRRFSAEDHADPPIFDLGVAALCDLEKKGVRPFTLRAFEAGLLRAAGLAPILGFCVHCKKEPGSAEAARYSFQQSGILCTQCGEGAELPLLPAAPRRLLMKILEAGPDEIFELPHDKADLETLSFLLPRQIEYHLGSALKSLRWARNLLRPAEFSGAPPLPDPTGVTR